MSTSYGAVPTGEAGQTSFTKKKSCNDVFWALLFLAHLGGMAAVWITYEPENEYTDYMDRGAWKFAGSTTAVALVLSTLALVFMTYFADELVEIALISSLVLTLVVLGYGLYIWNLWMAIIGGIAFVFGFIYTWWVWNRIQFAAANFRTALTAVRTNFGLIIVAYCWEIVAFAWTVLWINASGALMNEAGSAIVFLLLLSFFWTHQVINNIQHTIVSSVIGTWWFKPDDANFCWDDGLNSALCQSVTYSFGSVCFGSLVASIVQALKWTHRFFARYEGNAFAKCLTAIIDCVLSCIQRLIEYFNKWAYTIVGIKGESYLNAGRQAIDLFKKRGWVAIITDALADEVMFFMKISIGLSTGLMGWWLVRHDNDIFVGIGIEEDNDDMVGFIAGTLIGYVVSSIMMELVSSAINAVIVCFAEAPANFQQNYPELCKDMLTAWVAAYPSECSDDFDSLKA